MKQDKRLEKFIDVRVVVISKAHPHYGKVGTGKRFVETEYAWGLDIAFDDGEAAFVFDKSEIKPLLDEKEADMTQEEIIENLAACNYEPEQIAKYLELDKATFMKEWFDRRSKVRYHYDKGALEATFDINKNLLKNAKKGNITSAQIFFKKAEEIRVDNLKKQIFTDFE